MGWVVGTMKGWVGLLEPSEGGLGCWNYEGVGWVVGTMRGWVGLLEL